MPVEASSKDARTTCCGQRGPWISLFLRSTGDFPGAMQMRASSQVVDLLNQTLTSQKSSNATWRTDNMEITSVLEVIFFLKARPMQLFLARISSFLFGFRIWQDNVLCSCAASLNDSAGRGLDSFPKPDLDSRELISKTRKEELRLLAIRIANFYCWPCEFSTHGQFVMDPSTCLLAPPGPNSRSLEPDWLHTRELARVVCISRSS